MRPGRPPGPKPPAPRAPQRSRPPAHRPPPKRGLHYNAGFVSPAEREAVVTWLATLHPLVEARFGAVRPAPPGEEGRMLLRPVYWLGNWQFACLGYYQPPRGLLDRCVAAEPFPPPLQAWVKRAESWVKAHFGPDEVPKGWHLNTCLVNFYGDRVDGRREDRARVGDHRDDEPGPVASISLGERALFQFTRNRREGGRLSTEVVHELWLADSSLQIFAGDFWKRQTFHRVQRVERKQRVRFDVHTPGFEIRRINFTFRYVPVEHVQPLAALSSAAQTDVLGYIRQLAAHAPYWRAVLDEG
jgi:alkylated DNA repair protein (DNA oxidative demethylase)